MKRNKCTLIINCRNGYCLTPVECNSVSEAVMKGKEGTGFAYRIFDSKGEILKRGFCD